MYSSYILSRYLGLFLRLHIIAGYVASSLINSHGGWAPDTDLMQTCQCATGIPPNTFCRCICVQIAKHAKGTANCICRNNTYTGSGCPYIGNFC